MGSFHLAPTGLTRPSVFQDGFSCQFYRCQCPWCPRPTSCPPGPAEWAWPEKDPPPRLRPPARPLRPRPRLLRRRGRGRRRRPPPAPRPAWAGRGMARHRPVTHRYGTVREGTATHRYSHSQVRHGTRGGQPLIYTARYGKWDSHSQVRHGTGGRQPLTGTARYGKWDSHSQVRHGMGSGIVTHRYGTVWEGDSHV